MPHVSELIKAKQEEGKPFIAFEYFPPRTDTGVKNLYDRFERMAALKPLYTDVTWGAGGGTSDLTLELCVEAKKRYGLEMNMHLTCTNMPAEKVDIALDGAKEGDIHNICALRGDAPVGQETWEVVEGGFACGLDLVKYIREKHGDHFCLCVAGYPEGHPDTIKKVEDPSTLTESERARAADMEDGFYVCSDEDYEKEIDYLKRKVDAGGDFIVTQMFFDTDVFLRFVEDCRRVGITVPVIPGVMLIQNAGGFQKMTRFCKTRVPADIRRRFEAVKDDAEAVKELGVEVGTEMSRALLDGGVPGLHYYTLNLEKVVVGILRNLGMLEDGYDAVKEEQERRKEAEEAATA